MDIWSWKEETIADRLTGIQKVEPRPQDAWLGAIAAAMSAYLEMTHERLLDAFPVVTTLPSRVPLVATALAAARELGWFSVEPEIIGQKSGHWSQHLSASKQERLSRNAEDWSINASRVNGRSVLIIDDVWTTGASAFSFASALRAAGAKSVSYLAVARHIQLRDVDYWDAIRIVRRQRPWVWTLENTIACQPTFDFEPEEGL